jgi:hypothetical protein
MKLLIAAAVLCVAAHAQVSGTIIVFDATTDGFFIAADSRAVFNDKRWEDTHCKIAAIDENVVFAVSAAAAYPADSTDPVPAWDAIREARTAANIPRAPSNSGDAVVRIADAWAKQMETKWNLVKRFHPEKLREAELHGKGVLTNGIFAVGGGDSVSFTVRSIRSENANITWEAPPITCTLCASGELGVFLEFAGRTSDRAKSHEGDLPASPLLTVVRLVDLTIAYDKSGNVGGPIDALRLARDGRITWFQKKRDCAENYR